MRLSQCAKILGLAFVTTGLVLISAPAAADIIHADDVIIDFSLCVGIDCVNGENFGSDTIRLDENNLRIHFEDSSASASFPDNDWRFIFNGQNNGDPEYFAVQDASAGRNPFTIEAAAPANTLYVEADGDVGIKTMNPVVDIHVIEGNTPTLRLEQDGSDGFNAQTWDVAGNEANFFVRDVTNGSDISFKILPNPGTNKLVIGPNGVGIGKTNPSVMLDVNGDATISGNVSMGSSRAFKEDLGTVDSTELLAVLAELPIHTWRYKTESEEIRHIGPMAEDFYHAFGFSNDPSHISIVDANGIALAAVQELHTQLEAKDKEIAALMQRLDALEEKLEP